MQCPGCRTGDSKVVESRDTADGTAIRRRRECLSCRTRFTTYERVDHAPLTVLKSSGDREPFDRGKVVAGLAAATKGRSVSDSTLTQMATRVEDAVRVTGQEVTSAVIGLAVLEELRIVDEVAYLRFASVYKDFDAAADFHRELELLQKESPDSSPA